MYYIYKYNSPLGIITLISNGKGLISLSLPTQSKYQFDTSCNVNEGKDQILEDVTIWLDKYFNNEKPTIDKLKLIYDRSSFSNDVLDELLKIDYGQTVTYGDISKKIAKKYNIKKMSSQAVGGAISKNPIPIIIPCHRVIGANNNLTGYTGGIDIKVKLLELEGHDMSKYHFNNS